nr:uncharacterized protein LOC118033283 isoform X1 [Populus alba]
MVGSNRKWRSRFSCPTHWNKDNSEWISKGIETKHNCSLQNLVPGKTGQVAGWTQVYGDILSFAAIRGASHGVPFSQPKRSIVLFKLFNAFLEGKQLPQAL